MDGWMDGSMGGSERKLGAKVPFSSLPQHRLHTSSFVDLMFEL